MSTVTPVDDEDPVSANQVYLRGRLGDGAVARELPSGDMMVTFRLSVPRSKRRARGRVRVDSLECVSTLARVRRCIERASPGDRLEVTGALERRFWRGAGGAASRYAVDVTTVRAIRAGRSDRSDGASTTRKQVSA